MTAVDRDHSGSTILRLTVVYTLPVTSLTLSKLDLSTVATHDSPLFALRTTLSTSTSCSRMPIRDRWPRKQGSTSYCMYCFRKMAVLLPYRLTKRALSSQGSSWQGKPLDKFQPLPKHGPGLFVLLAVEFPPVEYFDLLLLFFRLLSLQPSGYNPRYRPRLF